MSELRIKIPTETGDVEVTFSQMMAVADCIAQLQAQGKVACWHKIDCGCCVTVHEAGVHPVTGGFIVNEDGGYGWEEAGG